jgi:L-asparaginase/Glu-tRNA(Gln) amidotransferase subunit D
LSIPTRVAFYRASTKRHTARSEFDVGKISTLPKVEILYAYAEPSVDAIKAVGAAGAGGIVFAGTGAGGLSDGERAAIKALGRSSRGRSSYARIGPGTDA